jgi:hypothetical protein
VLDTWTINTSCFTAGLVEKQNTSFVTKFRDHITNNIDNFTHVGGNIVVRDSKIRNNRKD